MNFWKNLLHRSTCESHVPTCLMHVSTYTGHASTYKGHVLLMRRPVEATHLTEPTGFNNIANESTYEEDVSAHRNKFLLCVDLKYACVDL